MGGSGSLEKGNFESVLNWFKNEDSYAYLEDGDYANGTYVDGVLDGGMDSGSGSSDEGDPCYNAGIESMSWLLCPALNNTRDTVAHVDGWINSWLSVETNLYSSTKEAGGRTEAYQAWGVLRNIANIVLAIIFLVIIFSQLTGYGINNYGIKKILPRLIVFAILINLSFIICEIAVDISNILGSGLNNLFSNLAGAVDNDNVGERFIVDFVSTLMAAAGIAGAAAPLAITVIGVSGSPVMIIILIPRAFGYCLSLIHI